MDIFVPGEVGKQWGLSSSKLARGPELWFPQEDVKGSNLILDLKERPFFLRAAAHLGASGRNYSTFGNCILHLGGGSRHLGASASLQTRVHHLCRDHTKTDAREAILVMNFQDRGSYSFLLNILVDVVTLSSGAHTQRLKNEAILGAKAIGR